MCVRGKQNVVDAPPDANLGIIRIRERTRGLYLVLYGVRILGVLANVSFPLLENFHKF